MTEYARCPVCQSRMQSEVHRGSATFYCAGCRRYSPIQRREPTVDELRETQRMMTVAPCVDCGATRKIHARGRCGLCYKRWWMETAGGAPAIGSETLVTEIDPEDE